MVYVSTADELEKQLDSVGAQTIVITANIDMQKKSHTRIRDNKTIVGSYAAHTIYDSQFRTNDVYGAEDDSPSDNIVFRNLDMQAKNVANRILINIWSSRQIWIDHVNFNSSLSYDRTGNGQDEVGKFIWINTPYESYLDSKDRLRSPDYVTISYCKFTHRYWTVAYGTQNDEITRDRTTLLYNWWNEDVRRCPQLGNGSAHIYNNYYSGYDSGNGSGTAQIIGGDGSNMVSENCRFQAFSKTQALSMGTGSDPCRDSGSYISSSSSATPEKISFSPKTASTWYPNKENYGYSLLDAYNTKGTDTKDFCTKYAGCFSTESGIKYITDSDLSSYVSTKYASPFLKHVEFQSKAGAVLDTGLKYVFQNLNSGLYLDVSGANAASGTNVQQGMSADRNAYTWTVSDAGDGYYYIYTCLGDGKTYCLDLPHGDTSNGNSLGLWSNDESDARKFKFIDNGDGTFTITTKSTADASCLGVVADSTESGADVVQWTCNGNDSQKWYVGVQLDNTSGAAYRIKNVNSGLYMQIEGGAAENGANVQQWGTNGTSVHDIWKFYNSEGGYYNIVSAVGDGGTYVLDVAGKKTANGTNVDIYKYSNGINQQFMLTANGDGSYKIRTKVSENKSVVEIADASNASGANVQQWEVNGANCQDWVLESAADPGCAMDTSVIYTFENVNSGLVMDIVNGEMKDNSNVQQFISNKLDCQKWILKSFGSGNYYWIRSCQDNGYALKAEGSAGGSNIDITAYSSKDSTQLFRFTKNPDGTYGIITHASGDACLVEVANASAENGANVQQWYYNGNDCQKWNAVTEVTTVVTTTTTTTVTTTVTTTSVPETTEPIVTQVEGDVNSDGVFNISDVVMMQKWLLGSGSLTDWESGDLCKDGIINVFDLCLMKRLLMLQI